MLLFTWGLPFTGVLLLGGLDLGQDGCRVHVVVVEATLVTEQVLAVVLLEREAGAARGADVEGAADFPPFLLLGHLKFGGCLKGVCINWCFDSLTEILGH